MLQDGKACLCYLPVVFQSFSSFFICQPLSFSHGRISVFQKYYTATKPALPAAVWPTAPSLPLLAQPPSAQLVFPKISRLSSAKQYVTGLYAASLWLSRLVGVWR